MLSNAGHQGTRLGVSWRAPRRPSITGPALACLAVAVLAACGNDPQAGDQCVAPEPVSGTFEDIPVSTLDGLSFDEFVTDSFELLVRRSPESVTHLGQAEQLGLRDDRLDDVSDAYLRETYDVYEAILDRLRQHDRSQLDSEQLVTYDVYEWYLDDVVRDREFIYHDYPITPMITSSHRRLLRLLEDVHPVASRQNAEDFIARLRQVPEKLGQIRDGLDQRRDAGIVAPRFLLEYALPGLRSVADASPRATSLYRGFADDLAGISSLSAGERDELLAAAENAIACQVIPGFQAMVSHVERLMASAPTDDGVWQFDGGDTYYRHALRHHTTTEMSADEIHQLGLDEVARIRGEMAEKFAALGYPDNESLGALFGRVASDSGTVAAGQVTAEYQALIDEAETMLESAFDLRPSSDVVVVNSGGGAFYVAGTPDGSRPGQFFVNANGSQPRYAMPTLAYHEAVPGHHYQISLAQEQDLPQFRARTTFTAHVEGWGLYAEGLAADLGWYDDDVHGDLGRLQAEAFRAARLVVDTGIHAKRWTFEQAVQYMVDNVGFPRPGMEAEVSRYVSWPGQATAYKTGMLRLRALRQQVMDRQGEDFDLPAFHRVILTNGSVPLDVLDRIIARYIDSLP